MPLDPRQTKLNAKEKTCETLARKYADLEDQISSARDADDKINLKNKQKQIEQEMNDVYREIENLRAQIDSGTPAQERQEHNLWESKICKIDYKKANEIFDRVLKRLEKSGGHVLFLLQESASMGGTWCIQELRDRLNRMPGEMTKPQEFSFSSYEHADAQRIVNLLAASYLKEDSPKVDDWQLDKQIIDQLIHEIAKSLFSGAILYIQINIKCPLEDDNLFLHWFIQDFWSSLTCCIPETKRNRLIAVISVDEAIPDSCLPANAFSTKERVNARSSFKLSLNKWTEQDISNWLIDCSGLDRPPMNLSEEAMQRIAVSIHRKSKGQPATVYNCLKEELENIKLAHLNQCSNRVG